MVSKRLPSIEKKTDIITAEHAADHPPIIPPRPGQHPPPPGNPPPSDRTNPAPSRKRPPACTYLTTSRAALIASPSGSGHSQTAIGERATLGKGATSPSRALADRKSV